MHRRIIGFHRDQEAHWVADLECGHAQHVRHEPPLTTRPWVLEERSRQEHLGTLLDCLICDGLVVTESDLRGLSSEARARYNDARLSGLCHEGALEVARGVAPPDRPISSA